MKDYEKYAEEVMSKVRPYAKPLSKGFWESNQDMSLESTKELAIYVIQKQIDAIKECQDILKPSLASFLANEIRQKQKAIEHLKEK